MDIQKYDGVTDKWKWTRLIRFHPSDLDVPVKRNKPTTYFVCSMSDLFHEKAENRWRDQIFDVMEKTPQHTFQVLTKRSKNMVRYINGRYADRPIPQNIWMGVSVETPEYLSRARDLMLVNPVVRFLSVEPLLAPVAPELDAFLACLAAEDRRKFWIIFGGESGKGARPCSTQWIGDGVKVCQKHGAMPFVKQLGSIELLPNGTTTRHRSKRDNKLEIIKSLGECAQVDPKEALHLGKAG